jgi:hypothetical protein
VTTTAQVEGSFSELLSKKGEDQDSAIQPVIPGPSLQNTDKVKGPQDGDSETSATKSQTAPKRPQLDDAGDLEDLKPCGYFRTRIAALIENGSIDATQTWFELPADWANDTVMEMTPRPIRPLFVPVRYDRYIVLVVIQMEESGEARISVLDSKPHYYNQDKREEIYQGAIRTLRSSYWTRHPINGHYPVIMAEPADATWMPVAPQRGDAECGYHTILNAWSLALGLSINPENHLPWSDQFFHDLQDVLHLA